MSKHQENKGIRSQTGLAYVAILLLLTVLSTMGFAFLFKVGIETAATETRGKSMQVDYLAESAANHALWRLLNEPGFNPAPDTYYMHSLGNGRYGYKIRKPTETTFATVATVGAVGDSVANQSYVQYIIPSNVFTAYGSSSNAFPFYRRLIGANWTDPADVAIGGATTYWVELEGCPTRKEVIAAFIDSANAIKVTVYNGTAWGSTVPFGQGDMNYKCFDIAYESQSGDALVVARDGTATPLYYNIWDGSAWAFANPQVAFSLPGGDVRDVVMASQPGGNEILIAVVTSSGHIQVVRWDGSAFHDLGTIATKAARCDFRVVEIVYEHQSGDAMVVWSITGDSALKFRMWNGAALGSEGSLPDFNGNTNFMIRGAADSDPTSDHIVIAAIDNFYDINVAVWDGDAWIDSREIEISNSTHLAQSLDIAWEAAGEDAVIAWAPWTATNVRFMAWKKGTALADCAIQEGPDLQNQGWLVRLLPISGTEKIVLLGQNNLSDLRYCLWTGDGCKGDPTILLEADMPVQNDVAFDLAEANVPRTGGTGSAAGGGNQVPFVDAGPNQTVCPPVLEANLDGTVTDDGLPNPPAAVTIMWSQVSGPGTVTFDDASLVDATATFSEAGEYVLRLTANDSALGALDEVTITVKESQVYMTYGSDTIMIDMGGGPVPQIFSSPKYKPYDGSAWGFNGLVMDLSPLVTDWMELEAAFNKEEMVMGATQDNDSLHLAVFDGTSWGNPLQFTSASDSSQKCYDIAYESQSGDALVVGRSGTSSMAKYTVWDGSTWTNDPPADAFDYGGGNLGVVEMESSPLSDEILVAVVDSGKDLYLYQWDGNSFNSLGLLDDWVTVERFGIVKIVYEQQSGDALIIWGHNSSPTPKYRIWDGSTLGDEQSLPDFGQHPKLIRADADSASDYIFVAALDPIAHINVAVWDGNSWIDSREIETAAVPGANYCLDVAWMPSGNEVLVGWHKSSQNFLYYFDWTKGTALSSSSIQVGPNFFSTVETLQLLPLKTRGSIMVVGVNGVNGLYYTIWDGATFDPDPSEFIVELVKDAVPTFDVVELACTSGGSLLFVVSDASNLSTQENARKALMQSWGWSVTLIDDGDTQANFDSAAAANDVAYISQEAVATTLGSKLNGTPIGVVNENKDMIDDFGFATGVSMGGGLPTLNVDMSHYITSVFAANPVAPYVANDWYQIVNEPVAAGVDPVGTWVEAPWTGKPALMALSQGTLLIGGGTAAGCRVQIPWGSGQGASPVALASLSSDAKTIMRRSIEWAAACSGGGGDTDPPTPDPMTWASPPAAVDPFSITMTATTGTDPSGVEYYFECTAGGGNDSGWQDSTTYVDTGLSPSTLYTYRVKARDKSPGQNETSWSSEASATTESAEIYVYDISFTPDRYHGQWFVWVTVWIKDVGGNDISGALVTGDWSDDVSGTSMGSTGGDGKVTLDSPSINGGGIYTFTVTDVSKSGYVYNPALNVETSDTIWAP